ncbi:hypothetical protein SESBI_50368 [Sesbania bispinosa]|nr:hypothetical protein SESBI_50368 [Sesbania bispinosa]
MASSTDVHMEPKPPDGTEAPRQNKASFKDKLLGSQVSNIQREKVDLIGCNLFRIEHEDGNRLKPRSKKPNSNRVKGKAQVTDQAETSLKKVQDQPKVLIEKPTSETLSNDGVVFIKSSSLNVKHVFDSSSHGIKIILNVDILSANRMRFRDEDDPGGVLVTGKSDINHEQDVENVPVDDMHEEGSNLPQKDVKSNSPC